MPGSKDCNAPQLWAFIRIYSFHLGGVAEEEEFQKYISLLKGCALFWRASVGMTGGGDRVKKFTSPLILPFSLWEKERSI